jgi:CHRD domain
MILFYKHEMSAKTNESVCVGIATVFTIIVISSLIVFVIPTKYSSNVTGGLNNKNGNIPNSAADTVAAVFLQSAYGQPQGQEFTAKMTGTQEVPPKDTKATGTATFVPTPDQMTLAYRVSSNTNYNTMAHIHKGKAGENGPIVFTFFTSPTPGGIVPFTAHGNLRANDLEGPLAGKQITDLIKMIKDGDAYVNVHTVQNPNGEIRGQISISSSASASAAVPSS